MAIGGLPLRPEASVGASVLSAIGATPLVELSRITAGLDGRVVAKLEYLSPGGSKKDRIALRMVQDAEASGALAAGQPVVELTSGNTGTGLAIVCAVKGHPFVAVMSAGNSVERGRMMRALGAEVILVDQQEGSLDGHVSGDDLALVEAVAARVAAERGAFRADQCLDQRGGPAGRSLARPLVAARGHWTHICAVCSHPALNARNSPVPAGLRTGRDAASAALQNAVQNLTRSRPRRACKAALDGKEQRGLIGTGGCS